MFLRSAFLLIGALAASSLAAQTPAAGYDTLQDLWVFQSTEPTNWAGGDLLAPGNAIPVDANQTYNGLPSLSFNVPVSSLGYWNAILAGVDWRPYSIEFYQAHGYLEFNIKGAAGGEQFNLVLSDLLPSRLANTQLSTAALHSASYVATTTSWQHVRIPLSAFVAPSGFDFRQVRSMQLSNASGGSYVQQFWLNSIEFTSPDTEPSYPAIKVNQIGYTTQAWKYATVSGFGELLTAEPGTVFEVMNASTNQAAYTGQLTLVTNYDVGVSGEKVLNAEFTSLTAPGSYYIHVEAAGVADSLPFTIGDDVLRPMQRAIQRYYFYQRQGIAIGAQYADAGYARGLGHPNDVIAQFRSHSSPTIDVSHGWYDAGDYGKYTNNTSLTSAGLLDAYSIAPTFFNGLQVNIPESGNGMPDLLNEVKWELDFLVKMQDPASGGFYVQATSTGCMPNGDCKPEEITLTRYVEDVIGGVPNVRPTAPSAMAVAALARAAGIYNAWDATQAQSYLATAEAGWAYLLANPANIEATGFGGQSTDDQERMWAAAELFRTTGDAQYSNYFLANYQNYAAHFSSTTGSGTDIIFRAFNAYNGSTGADATERAWFTTNFAIWRGIQLQRMTGAWRNFMPAWGYYWSSNAETLTTVLILAQGEAGTTAPSAGEVGEIVDAAQAQINYILGVNPLHRSFVSGFGGDTVQTVFSSIYPAYGLYTPPPGYLPGGPDIDDSPWYSQFPARCYADTDTDWPVSEHDIGYTAPLVFTAAYVAQNSSASHAAGNVMNTPVVSVAPTPASPTIAQNLAVKVTVAGTPSPTGTVTLASGTYTSAATALAGGSVTITVPAGALPLGSNTLLASYTADSGSFFLYNNANGTAAVTVTAVPVSFALSGPAVTLSPGATMGNTSTITVTPSGGFTGNVTLTAAITASPDGAQNLPTLSFGATSPVNITGASAATATLTISTTAPSSAALERPGAPWKAAGAVTLACLLLFGLPARRRGWRRMLGLLALAVFCFGGVLSCGGGGGGGSSNPGTTPGAYTVTVTGSTSSVTESTTVTVTVN
jgi:hypothetical protein